MNYELYFELKKELSASGAKLIAVSKTKPAEAIFELYNKGQRLFGENKVQEMISKHDALPADIEWHMIGHLQTNKVKYIAPFVALIHSVDSLKLLQEIDKQGRSNNRVIPCLIQVHIALEESKFGFDAEELSTLFESSTFKLLKYVQVAGLMGMASNTENTAQIRREFKQLQTLFKETKENNFSAEPQFCELSMGMSSDYKIALEFGTTLVRIGSMLFGARH